MFKDPGNQSYLWSGFSGLLAWFEGRMLKRENERKEELHQVRMARLKKGLDDEVT